jgi:hypothetical protein
MTRFQSAYLRRTLPRGIFWVQIIKGGISSWNWTLLQSYLLNGLDSPESSGVHGYYPQSRIDTKNRPLRRWRETKKQISNSMTNSSTLISSGIPPPLNSKPPRDEIWGGLD